MGRCKVMVAFFLALSAGLPGLASAATPEQELQAAKQKYEEDKRTVVEQGHTEVNQQAGMRQGTDINAIGNRFEQPQQAAANPHNAADYN